MQDLMVSFIQTDLYWEDTHRNLSRFETKIKQITGRTDILVLPEMFNTGFTMNVKPFAESMDGSTMSWLKEKAARNETVIITSLIIEEENRYYNRLVMVRPDTSVEFYDKRHLFRMADEHQVFSSGEEMLTVNINGWNIRPFVCYDLRFPVWTRNQNNAYDVAIFIANWPDRRINHWMTLLKARAIENQAFVVGVNRIGKDGMGIEYSGASCVIDPLGKDLIQKRMEDTLETMRLSHSVLKSYREKFPVWKDTDRFSIEKEL